MIIIGRPSIESFISTIHDILPQQKVGEYITKIVSDTNIDLLYDLLSKACNSKIVEQPRLDILIYLLCNESISINEISSFIDIDEYSLYFILATELNRLRGFSINRKKKVIDYIPKLEYGMIDMRSYKDINNIVSELEYMLKNLSDIDLSKILEKRDDMTDDDYYKSLIIYIINNYIMINGDFINLSYNNEYTISSELTHPEIWELMPYVSFYLNNNKEMTIIDNIELDVDINNAGLDQSNFNFDNIKTRYSLHEKAKEIAKLLPIILERTINYNEV